MGQTPDRGAQERKNTAVWVLSSRQVIRGFRATEGGRGREKEREYEGAEIASGQEDTNLCRKLTKKKKGLPKN